MMVFFEGRMFPQSDAGLLEAMRKAVRDSEGSPVLLLKADASVSSGRLDQLIDYAREAGFVRVLKAREDSRSVLPQVKEGAR
jgi:biopolymer transport protein ExbD